MDGGGADPYHAEDMSENRTQPVAAPARPTPSTRFPVDVPGFSGSLEQLVVRAQRGEVDLDAIAVAEITAAFRAQRRGGRRRRRPPRDGRLPLPGGAADRAEGVRAQPRRQRARGGRGGPGDDAGRRLTEYRLFKAAAEALLAEAAEEGTRSFLGLVAPEVIPVERLRIPPERLAAAFREVLVRLSEAEPLPIGAVTFSVDDKMDELRARLRGGVLAFDDLFAAVTTRLEAVACFLALLELLRLGEAVVDQDGAFGPITVRAGG